MSNLVEIRWRLLATLALNALVLGILTAMIALPDARSRLLGSSNTVHKGVPQIGGAFDLVSQHGTRVSASSLRGRHMLVTFGYASNPDTTPATVQILNAVLEALGAKADLIVPLLITLDPKNDTPAILKAFASRYNHRLLTLTGTEAEIAAVARAFKQPVIHSVDGGTASGSVLAYEPLIFLMDQKGRYVAHWTHEVGADAIIAVLRGVL
jgi:protein SCO1